MELLLIVLMLLSPFSFAVVGDVYYCKTLKDIRINKDGSLTSYDTVSFNFKEDERGCSALICILKTDNVVDVDEVTGFVGVEAYGGIGFVTTVVKVFAIVVVCTGQ